MSASSRNSASPARYQTVVPDEDRARGDGRKITGFIGTPEVEGMCRVTKDTFAGPAGDPIELRDWQVDLLTGLFARRADGRLRHRQALIGMPRKNGKTCLGAGIGLYGLFMGPTGAEVYSCAGDRDQARICFNMAKQMVEAEPELLAEANLYRDTIEIRSTNSIYRVLSSEAYTKEGLSPTLVIFDEVHVQPDDELWNVMTLGSAARVDPLVLGITTAGVRTDNLGRDTLCYRLYQHGQQVVSGEMDDPSFYFAWWEPAGGAEADHHSEDVWRESNPAYGDLVDPEDFASVVLRTPESEFRTKRTNVFTTHSDPALPFGTWDLCADPNRVVTLDDQVVLFVDGSFSGDSTGVVGCTTDGYLFTRSDWIWERPDYDEGEWRVPISDVERRLHEACRQLSVFAVAFDPYRWQATMQKLMEEGLPVEEWPTGALPRIIPAWKRFYDGVMDKTLSHDGNLALARHLENMRLKIDSAGVRPVKEHKDSRRHIDLGICAVGAFDIATSHRDDDGPSPFVVF